jgi:hypothetical protein
VGVQRLNTTAVENLKFGVVLKELLPFSISGLFLIFLACKTTGPLRLGLLALPDSDSVYEFSLVDKMASFYLITFMFISVAYFRIYKTIVLPLVLYAFEVIF